MLKAIHLVGLGKDRHSLPNFYMWRGCFQDLNLWLQSRKATIYHCAETHSNDPFNIKKIERKKCIQRHETTILPLC